MPRLLRIKIYNLSGPKIRPFSPQTMVRGRFDRRNCDLTWDRRDDLGNLVSSGIYLYRIALDLDEGFRTTTDNFALIY